MPAVLTHKAIMLLARRRLGDIRDRLQAKVDGGAAVTDLEHRILYLARRAHRMMSVDEGAEPSIEFPENATTFTGAPLGDGVSTFSVLGSMGPDLTGFSGLFLPGQAWVFDTVHKGTPDGHRELVVAGTTDLPLELWRQVRDGIDARHGAAAGAKELAKDQMRAYVMGHLCHVAGDVVSHPFVNDVEWHLGVRSDRGKRERLEHSGTEVALDAQVARSVFLREGIREGQEWTVWWPPTDGVPEEFFQAYDAALRSVYDAGGPRRPRGFGEFEEAWQDRLPELSPSFVKDGWSMYRRGILSMGYGWGWWNWWGYLAPLVVPLALTFPLIPALPRGRQFLEKGPWDSDERAWFEALMLPLTLGTVTSAFYGIWLATLSTHGIEVDVVLGLVSAFLTLLLGIIFFATLGTSDEGFGAGIRWLLLWLPAAGFGLYHLVRFFVDFFGENRPKGALFGIYAAPVILMLLVFVLLGFLGGGMTALVDALGGDVGTSAAAMYGIFTVIVVGGVLVMWFVLPSILRDARIVEDPEPFAAQRPHFVRVFDDTTLFHESASADPELKDLTYPSDRRKLLKLWWDGPDDLWVRSRRTHLEFSLDGEGEADQVVTAPVTPMTAAEYAALLSSTVQDGTGATGHLQVEGAYADDPEGPLPPGATFSDEGDGSDTVLEHADKAGRWIKLEKSAEAADYFLRHGPRPAHAVRFGRNGAFPFDPREPGSVSGPGTLESDGKDLTGTGTDFQAFFNPGDRIRGADQIRTITLITSATELRVSSEFNPALPGGTGYVRVGPEEQSRDGHRYVTDTATSVLGGEALMDYAADLGALLCLGATPHLLDDTELEVDTLAGRQTGGAAVDRQVGKVHQVFRNWSLDRRRENEWRTLVAGEAFDEKGGDPKAYDSAMPTPRDPSWAAPSDPVVLGEPWTRRLGWVPLMRRWLDMADDPASNAADPAAVPDGPTNQELSRAMAYLFDLPDARVLD